MLRFWRLMLLSCSVFFVGCATDPDSEDDSLNHLWRQGYGYNNPNPDRIRRGEAPLNFDGSQGSR